MEKLNRVRKEIQKGIFVMENVFDELRTLFTPYQSALFLLTIEEVKYLFIFY